MHQQRGWLVASLALGIFAFSVVLAYHQTVDGDLWARLAVGAQVWRTGYVLPQDIFAFTPTLPQWIDHEWGAGAIFFGVLKLAGPLGLMGLKIVTAVGAVWLALAAGTSPLNDQQTTAPSPHPLRWRGSNCGLPSSGEVGGGCRWGAGLLLAIPCAFAVLPGYVPVVRSHALTFLFFALTLWLLERVRAGRRWPLPALVAVMLVWANVHGGFVVGLGTIAIYAACVTGMRRALVITLVAALASTLINPYGVRFWQYLIPALLHPRPDVPEWGPMPLWELDPYVGFRILFVIALGIVAAGWRRLSVVGAVMLIVTAAVTFASRRHAPFFGLAALVYLPSCLAAVTTNAGGTESTRWRSWLPRLLFALYGLLTATVCLIFLPRASLEPAVPNGYYPVRAVDVLDAAGVRGNLAVPFRWGSYASWRLFPNIQVSVDGRYEETYPEETFRMNRDFFYKLGDQWDRLLKQHRVDFIVIDLTTTRLCPDDLHARGYTPVYTDAATALFARNEYVESLHQVATTLPPTTREPLDPRLPDRWLP